MDDFDKDAAAHRPVSNDNLLPWRTLEGGTQSTVDALKHQLSTSLLSSGPVFANRPSIRSRASLSKAQPSAVYETVVDLRCTENDWTLSSEVDC